MNGKRARQLRKVLEAMTIGMSEQETRRKYRLSKKMYKEDKTRTQTAKPRLQRNPPKEIVGGTGIKKTYQPNRLRKYLLAMNRVKKGYIGMVGYRYHPTKGYRKDKDYSPKRIKEATQTELE